MAPNWGPLVGKDQSLESGQGWQSTPEEAEEDSPVDLSGGEGAEREIERKRERERNPWRSRKKGFAILEVAVN